MSKASPARRQVTTRMAMVILAGLLGVVGAACMREDDGEQSRRTAAIDIDKSSTQDAPILSVTAVNNADPKGLSAPASGSVWQTEVPNGVRHPDGAQGIECASAAAPGRTCRWQYLREEATGSTRDPVNVGLKAAPSPGSRVEWTGCSYLWGDTCWVISLGSGRSVKASFEPLPKG